MAVKACEERATSSSVTNCLSTVRSSIYFNVKAAEACKNKITDRRHDEIVQCLQSISGRDYFDGEVSACKVFPAYSVVSGCLGAVGEPYGKRRDFTGRSEGVAVCETLMFNEKVIDCMKMVKSAHYLNPSAALACAVATRVHVTECIQTIKDKAFNEDEVKACRTASNSETITPCLDKIGTPYFK
jgi:hypothetical protein